MNIILPPPLVSPQNKMKGGPRRRGAARVGLLGCLLLAGTFGGVRAQSADGITRPPDPKNIQGGPATEPVPDHINLWNQDQAENQSWMVHFQNTDIVQGNPPFHSNYENEESNSLPASTNIRETISIDLYLGAHLWPGGELYFDIQPYQGFGLGNTTGLAAFPNGEAFKSGNTYGNVIIPHLFYRQTWGFGGEQEQLASGELQLAQKADISRLTFQAGKFSVADYFDNNAYSHDPTSQFLNWGLMDSGGFDFAQDADGNMTGAVLDFNQKNWALLYGYFNVVKYRNSHAIDYNFEQAWEQMLELDERYSINDHPGTVRLIGWLLSADMGSYWDTINDPNANMDITQTSHFRKQFGFVISADQEITKDLGVFTRLSWGQPNDADQMYLDMSESAAAGMQLMGTAWSRPNDVVGFGDTVGFLSQAQRTYYADGGLGETIGDGALTYAPENVTEAYYNYQITNHLNLTGDFQLAYNPGFNAARGPVAFFALRLHTEF
jgi:high affinity Mn2+ porin